MPASSQMMGRHGAQSEIWLDGRTFLAATAMGGNTNRQDRTYDIYGREEKLQDSNTINGSFSMTVLTSDGDIEFQHMARGYNPNSRQTGLEVLPDDSTPLVLFVNVRKPDDSGYWKGRLYGMWSPSAIGDETAGFEDVSQPSFAGSTDQPIEIDDGFFYTERPSIASGSAGYTGTCAVNGWKPVGSNNYAYMVVGLSGTGPVEKHSFSRGPELVSSAGVVTVNANDMREAPSDWNGKMSAVLVVKAGTGTGTNKTNDWVVAASVKDVWNN